MKTNHETVRAGKATAEKNEHCAELVAGAIDCYEAIKHLPLSRVFELATVAS